MTLLILNGVVNDVELTRKKKYIIIASFKSEQICKLMNRLQVCVF